MTFPIILGLAALALNGVLWFGSRQLVGLALVLVATGGIGFHLLGGF